MNYLYPLIRNYVLLHGQAYLLRRMGEHVSQTINHHTPLGGTVTIQHILSMLTWREQMRLAQCNTACEAIVTAIFGRPKHPVEIRPKELEHIVRSRLGRHTRHVRLICTNSESPSSSSSTSLSSSSSSSSAPTSSSNPYDNFISEVTESRLDLVRQLPILRYLTLTNWYARDSRLLVWLTRRPVLGLLQYIRIEHGQCIDPPTMECFKLLPALHTLILKECHMVGAKLFAPLSSLSNLSTLSLNFQSGSGFSSDELLNLMEVKKLRQLHLHTLLAPAGLMAIDSVFGTILQGGVFTQQLEHLSLCYSQLASSGNSGASANRNRSTSGARSRGNSHSGTSSGSSSIGSSDDTSSNNISLVSFYSPLSCLLALRSVELSWVQPLGEILPQIAKLPRLTTIVIGDDNLPIVRDGILHHLIGSTSLRHIALYGFVGLNWAQHFRPIFEAAQTRLMQLHRRSIEMRYIPPPPIRIEPQRHVRRVSCHHYRDIVLRSLEEGEEDYDWAR